MPAVPLSFNWSLDIGQVMNIVAIIGGGVWALAVARGQLDSMRGSLVDAKGRIGGVEAELKKLSEVIVSNARLEERLTAALLRITALEITARKSQGGTL